MSKPSLRFCSGPSCGPAHSEEAASALDTLAKEAGFQVDRCDCLGACPVGPNARIGSLDKPQTGTLLTGLESAEDFKKVLEDYEAARAEGRVPRTLVGRPPRLPMRSASGAPA